MKSISIILQDPVQALRSAWKNRTFRALSIAGAAGCAVGMADAAVQNDVRQYIEIDQANETIRTYEFSSDNPQYCEQRYPGLSKMAPVTVVPPMPTGVGCTPYDGLSTSLREQFDARKADVEQVDGLYVVDFGTPERGGVQVVERFTSRPR